LVEASDADLDMPFMSKSKALDKSPSGIIVKERALSNDLTEEFKSNSVLKDVNSPLKMRKP